MRRLYVIVDEFDKLFPVRPFTPDGHMVGSIGEAYAGQVYGLELLPPSYETHDARSRDGRLVPVKATHRDRVGVAEDPDHLIVLRLLRDASVEEVFNGPGAVVLPLLGKRQKTGQRPVSVSRLRKAMDSVADADRVATRETVWIRQICDVSGVLRTETHFPFAAHVVPASRCRRSSGPLCSFEVQFVRPQSRSNEVCFGGKSSRLLAFRVDGRSE